MFSDDFTNFFPFTRNLQISQRNLSLGVKGNYFSYTKQGIYHNKQCLFITTSLIQV